MVDFQQFMTKIINSLYQMRLFSEDELASRTGMGLEEAKIAFRQYVLESGLMPLPSINFSALGMKEVRVFMDFQCSLIDAIPMIMLSFRERGFLVSYYRVMHACRYVTRHAVPLNLVKSYEEFLGELVELGYLRNFEIKYMDASYRFSPSPYVFDYRRGEWNVVPVSNVEDRSLPTFKTERFPNLDEVDIKILVGLKRHPLQKRENLASSLGLTLEQVNEHLLDHVIGGDLIKGWYLYFGPKFNERDVLLIGAYFQDVGDNGALSEVLRLPYLIFLGRAPDWVESLNVVPGYRITSVLEALERIMRKSRSCEYLAYISPFYDLDALSSNSGSTFLENNFADGQWTFYPEMLLDDIRTSVRLGRKGYQS
ncbi:MAG: hypothetical protein ACP5UU_00640 [Thermoprotei archaeon]